jgi:hypothetical protein
MKRAGMACVAALACTVSCNDGPTAPNCGVAPDTASWQFLGLETHWVISLAETRDGLYAGTNGDGVWRTACPFAQTKWSDGGLPNLRVKALVAIETGGHSQLFAAAAHSGATDLMRAVVFASSDGARTWLERDGGLAARQSGAADGMSLIAGPGAAGHLIAGLGNAIMTSADYGTTWTVVLGDPAQPGPDVETLMINRVGTGTRIWAGGQYFDTNAFVDYSDDGGITWTATAVRPGDSLSDNNLVGALLTDSTDINHLYAGLPDAIWETHDAGVSWSVPLRTTHVGFVTTLLRVAGCLVAISSEFEEVNGGATLNRLGLYTSDDGGLTWVPLATPEQATGGYSAIAETDSTLIVGTSTGVWRVRFR